ncbi:MAG TPA: hypothetical protein ENN80_02515, partial [Candidatus Hydrogenedentes bacterium]|nr:hypothetical protein [Candidatus Hydrogenedentota bacterium]
RNAEGIVDIAKDVAEELVAKVSKEHALKGLVADAPSDDAVMINLGRPHGVEVGQRFVVLEEGEPIEVGGKVIAYRPKPVGVLEVTEVEDAYSICKVVKKNEGVRLAKEMKVKATPSQ